MGSWLMLVGVAGGERDRTPSVQVMSPLPGGRLHCVIWYGRCVPIAVRLTAVLCWPYLYLYLLSMIEWSVRGNDAALCQITVPNCYNLLLLYNTWLTCSLYGTKLLFIMSNLMAVTKCFVSDICPTRVHKTSPVKQLVSLICGQRHLVLKLMLVWRYAATLGRMSANSNVYFLDVANGCVNQYTTAIADPNTNPKP